MATSKVCRNKGKYMSLLGTQNYFKPFEHPWMFDYWDLQQSDALDA